MFSRKFLRVVATIVVTALVSGCAEFDRRGGVVAEVEDFVLFTAHTKSHRLFRSYLLIGVLLAAARQGGHNDADKAAIEGNLKNALLVAAEAYDCLYPTPSAKVVVVGLTAATTQQDAVASVGTPAAVSFTPPAICQFFDEKMARLDYSLFRLALSTIFNAESNVYLGEIRDKLIGKIPVLSASAKAAIYANKAVNETTTIVDDLLNLSFSSAGPLLTLLPLYRDSLELNMWLIIDNLTRACPSGAIRSAAPSDISTQDGVCRTLGYALAIMNNGNGDLRDWRQFVWSMNYATRAIDAYVPHFFLVTRLMWRTCRSLFGDTSDFAQSPDPNKNKCQSMLANALARDAFQQVFIQGEGGRIYSASLRRPSTFAHGRSNVPSGLSTAPARADKPSASPAPEPESTGSVAPKPSTSTPAR